jgi:hypothetical protein
MSIIHLLPLKLYKILMVAEEPFLDCNNLHFYSATFYIYMVLPHLLVQAMFIVH